ncbi:POK7 protein, partial [Mionectes macconnelli]|nr:POK7 protein [Mionectes macconnelli]
MAHDPETIVVPVQLDYFEWYLANSSALQAALTTYTGSISYHLPSHPLCKLHDQVFVGQKLLSSSTPVPGPTVFTDGSGKTKKAVVTWYDDHHWQHIFKSQDGSPQVVELRMVTVAFQHFPCAVNVVMDSTYVASLVQRLDKAVLQEVSNPLLFGVLHLLWEIIQKHSNPYYVLHVCSHTSLPGFVAVGNVHADCLVSAAALGPVPDLWQQAIASHQFFHQNWRALEQQFQLSHSESRSIIVAC